MRAGWREPRAATAAGIALAACVIGLYLPVWEHGFVEFDDPLYVTANAHVRDGLTLANLGWALTNGDAFLWHPITWWSYLLSAELHGIERAGPWLATNVVIHAVNVGLALWALLALTARVGAAGRRWACVFAVGVFALHPVQVESVAWVSARKELLAASFFCLTLVAYARYARGPSWPRYLAVAVCSALGAMAKGSHVSLPFLLLLFDVSPLRRLDGARTARSLAAEKLPLLAIQLAGAAANVAFASEAYNVWVRDPPLFTRIAAVVVNLVETLLRILWPVSLTIVYPNPLQPIHALPTAPWLLAAGATLLGVSALALSSGRAREAFAVGWFGFLGMLLPMSGLVPMGLRSPHDRYLMVPLLVLAMGTAFGIHALASTPRIRRGVAVAAGVALLLACATQTRRQIPVWRDDDALFEHALRVAGDDPIIHYSYGTALARRGDTPRALARLERAVSLHPDYADAHHNLGFVLFHQGESRRALIHLERAVEIRPDWGRALLHLGEARQRAGDVAGARSVFERAVAAEPASVPARAALGIALLAADRRDEAEKALRAALELDPDHAEARRALTWLEDARARSGPDR
jgi:Flp pilus assembly protein TadD